MATEDALRINLASRTRQVVLELAGPDGAVREVQCELRELNGTDRDAYMNFVSKRTKYDANGNSLGLTNYENVHSQLISLTLYNTETGKRFELKEIQTWPAMAQEAMYHAASEISGLPTKEKPEGE